MEGMHNDVLKLYAEIIKSLKNQTLRLWWESGVGTSYIPSDSDDLGIT
jgi:hypothetical protein